MLLGDGSVALSLDPIDLIGRVALAVVLGGAIGFEREVSAQPAGFRTHAVLCLGAALFGLVSIYGFEPFTGVRATTNVQVDVTRVASQVVVGVGFLGGGAILKERGSIRGLTTAASLWVTAAVGLAVGVGYWSAAVAVTVACLLTLVGLRGVRRIVQARLAREEARASFLLGAEADPRDLVGAIREIPGLTVRSMEFRHEEEGHGLEVVVRIKSQPGAKVEPLLAPLAERPEVEELTVVER